MNHFNRATISLGVIALTLLASAGWSLWFWSDASDDAARAAADTAQTKALIGQIQTLRPDAGALPIFDPANLPVLIGDALKAAGIDTDRLTQPTAEPPVRLGRSGLEQVPVRIDFHRIAVHQAVTFAAELSKPGTGLCVGDFQLTYSAPEPDAAADAGWNVQIVVSYLTRVHAESTGIPPGPMN